MRVLFVATPAIGHGFPLGQPGVLRGQRVGGGGDHAAPERTAVVDVAPTWCPAWKPSPPADAVHRDADRWRA
jgi:hypothetical protein